MMPWFPRGHREYDSWCGEGDLWTVDDAREASYATSQSCKAELYAVIQFAELTPVKILKIGFESDWPEGYPA